MFVWKLLHYTQIRCCSHKSTHIRILHDAFGLSLPEATNILRSIRPKDPDRFLDCIKMCRNLGYNDEDILANPRLLNSPPMVLEQHHMALEEGGFQNITAYILLKYRQYYSKTITELKKEGHVPEELNVAESFSSYFDPKPGNDVIDYKEFRETDRWRDIHHRLLKLYLRWRLGATTQEIEVLFRIHHMVQNKSVRFLCENIKLALEVGLTLKRLIKCGYVLHSYPNYIKEVLRDYGNIAGGDLRKAIHSCPKLFMISPKNYAKIYGILKKHEVSDEAIRNSLNIFQYSPETIQYRLEEIDRTPELKILKHHNKFLKLVVHHQRAKSRMCFLQELQMKCLPLKLLSTDGPIDTHIRNAMDLNNSKEIVLFIKSLLKIDEQQFEKLLKRHPYYCAVPMPQILDTYEYLKSIKFRNVSICNVPMILLYPKDKIKDALIEVKKNPSIGKIPISQTQRLNLTLYTLEKRHHFTGNGIWPEHTQDLEPNSLNKD